MSWEYDFIAEKEGGKVFVHWDDFKATYRGREKKDAKPLDLKHVKRISLMMRRHVFLSINMKSSLTKSVSSDHKKETSPCL